MFDQNAYEVRITEHHRRVAEIDRHAWKLQTEHAEPRTRLSERFVAVVRQVSVPAGAVLSGILGFALTVR